MNRKTKLWLIIAVSLILIGCIVFTGVMFRLGWDFTKLATTKLQRNTYEINDTFSAISVVADTADIQFAFSTDEKCKVECYEEENAKHSVTVQNNCLRVVLNDKKAWYEHIGISYDSPKITVYLPNQAYTSLSIKASTGDVYAKDIAIDTIDISLSTGGVELKDILCITLNSTASTGDISLENVIAFEKMAIKTTTGDVELEQCDSSEISVETDTGDVEGSFLSDKMFTVKSSTGDVDVPNTTAGGKCAITTNTGDIEISIK